MSILQYFLVISKTALGCSDPGIDFFFCSVFEVSGLSEVFEFCHFFKFSQSVSISSLSAWFVMYFAFPLCIIMPTFTFSEFRLFKCFFPFVLLLFFSLKRATPSANLKRVRFSPSTFIHSGMSAFLKTSSIREVNSFGESRSPSLTPLFIGDSSDTNASTWIPAIAWL